MLLLFLFAVRVRQRSVVVIARDQSFDAGVEAGIPDIQSGAADASVVIEDALARAKVAGRGEGREHELRRRLVRVGGRSLRSGLFGRRGVSRRDRRHTRLRLLRLHDFLRGSGFSFHPIGRSR